MTGKYGPPDTVEIKLTVTEWCSLISTMGNATGFIEAYLLRDGITDYQREGASWILQKLKTESQSLIGKASNA